MTDSVQASNAEPLTLDEVFVQKAPILSPRKSKLRLSPLSKKACLIHGIDPLVLRERDYASFYENGQDPEIQTMKYEMYTRTREKLMSVASEERAKLAAKASLRDDSFSTTDAVSIVSKTSMSTSLDQKEQEISTLIENEKRRLEKVARRQQKELMRMLAFETKSKEIMQKMQAKTEEQRRKEAERKEAKKKRDLQAAEEARVRELRQKARNEAEEGLMRLKAQEQFERDSEIRRRKALEEMEKKKRARAEEEERLKKREAHRLQTQKILEQQRKETERKILERERKEIDREAKRELKRLVDQQAAEAKRKEAAKRIASNLEASRKQQEEKRNELIKKQAQQEEFMAGIVRKKQADMLQRQQRNKALDNKRKVQLNKTRHQEEAHKKGVLTKIEQDEAHLRELATQRAREQLLIKAERDLQLQMKRENLERIKKAREYHLDETRRKAEANKQRCEEMARRKQQLMRLRQKKSAESRIKKDKLLSMLNSQGGGGGSQIRKVLRQVATDVGLQSKVSQGPADDADAGFLGRPPDEEPLGEKKESPNASYESPYVADDFLGIGHISMHD